MTQVRPIDGKCTGCFICDHTFEFKISKSEPYVEIIWLATENISLIHNVLCN